jgi:hypothetical protein
MHYEHPLEVIIIGLGGIGSLVAFGLSYSLQPLRASETVRIVLVDGGHYMPEHRDHEYFDRLGNKAEVQRRKLSVEFPSIFYRSISLYVAEQNLGNARAVTEVIQEGNWVLLGLDNHKSRKIVSDHCETLNNITVISGSNDGADTCTLQVFIRREGKDIKPPLTYQHPHIENPLDSSPADRVVNQSCEERVCSGKQLPATLFACACLMQNAFHTARRLERSGRIGQFPYREIYWDIARAKYRVDL